jgi:hypothetical protein
MPVFGANLTVLNAKSSKRGHCKTALAVKVSNFLYNIFFVLGGLRIK